MGEPTHHCSYCNRDIVPDERDDSFGPTGDLNCPCCGAPDTDYDEFGAHHWIVAIDLTTFTRVSSWERIMRDDPFSV